MKKLPFKVALVDFGGIVIEWKPTLFIDRIFGSRPPSSRPYALTAIFETDVWRRHDEGTLSLVEAMEELKQGSIWTSQAWSDLEELLAQVPYHRRRIPEGVALLENLKRQGVRLIGATNHGREYAEKALEKHNLFKLFDAIFFSYEHGVVKPQRVFFEKLLSEYDDVKREDCVFFDDVEANVNAAEEVGITGVLCEDMGKVIELMRERHWWLEEDPWWDRLGLECKEKMDERLILYCPSTQLFGVVQEQDQSRLLGLEEISSDWNVKGPINGTFAEENNKRCMVRLVVGGSATFKSFSGTLCWYSLFEIEQGEGGSLAKSVGRFLHEEIYRRH